MNSLIKKGEYIMSSISVDMLKLNIVVPTFTTTIFIKNNFSTTPISQPSHTNLTSSIEMIQAFNKLQKAVDEITTSMKKDVGNFTRISEAYQRGDSVAQVVASELTTIGSLNLFSEDADIRGITPGITHNLIQ